MLYQPKPRNRAAALARHVLVAVAGVFAGLGRGHSDGAYLDGMRGSELEDLGLRRVDDGSYRTFK
ncbi:hypothetical protein VW23_025215 [Devosia insulae DS-56]|uniref:DUF1127 domain-containing protein n=1 Tax=Devosia insulae DS-56 TaxID=1116389 RepID=A0A1E5XLL7_9HYPH|nr:hypothetical protein [Devosia insulae]OEO29513.1 hypothetical protein VW23_025215 [Devosia insulae DS-56]